MSAPTTEDKLLSTIGLCARARKLVMGTPMVCEAMRIRKPAVLAVLEASDTSENTHHKLVSKCTYYQIPLYRLNTHHKLVSKCTYYQIPLYRLTADTARLAHAVGKTGAVAAVGITDENFYKALIAHLPPREDSGDSATPHITV